MWRSSRRSLLARALGVLAALLLEVKSVRAEILSAPPSAPDTTRTYLIYSHGQIVEGSNGRPVSPDYGPYEYRAILARLEREGFTVISEIRPENAGIEEHAAKLQAWVQRLLDAGVPPRQIVVLGVSRGGLIALRASNRLANPKLRFVLLSSFFAATATRREFLPYGEILAIHDEADTYDLRPDLYLGDATRVPRKQILVTHTGRGHGLSYRPDDAWVDPVVAWSGVAAPRNRTNPAPAR